MNVVSTRGPGTGRDEDALLRDVLRRLSTAAHRGTRSQIYPKHMNYPTHTTRVRTFGNRLAKPLVPCFFPKLFLRATPTAVLQPGSKSLARRGSRPQRREPSPCSLRSRPRPAAAGKVRALTPPAAPLTARASRRTSLPRPAAPGGAGRPAAPLQSSPSPEDVRSSPPTDGADQLRSLLHEVTPISKGCGCPAALQGSNDPLE